MKHISLLFAFIFIFSNLAWAAVSDQDYINYQVEMQTILYKYAQDPTKMVSEMKTLETKYPTQSPEWTDYLSALQQDPTRLMKLHQQIDEELRKQGVGPAAEPEQK